MEYSMKFHHFFKWYLLIAGILGLMTNTLLWVLSFFDVTILTVTFSARDIWIHLDFVVTVMAAVVGIMASGRLRRMAPDSLGYVYAFLWLHVLSVVAECVPSLLNGIPDPFGLYLGYAIILVLIRNVFKYYRNRRELFVKQEKEQA